jgi:hypothetical protein
MAVFLLLGSEGSLPVHILPLVGPVRDDNMLEGKEVQGCLPGQ